MTLFVLILTFAGAAIAAEKRTPLIVGYSERSSGAYIFYKDTTLPANTLLGGHLCYVGNSKDVRAIIEKTIDNYSSTGKLSIKELRETGGSRKNLLVTIEGFTQTEVLSLEACVIS